MDGSLAGSSRIRLLPSKSASPPRPKKFRVRDASQTSFSASDTTLSDDRAETVTHNRIDVAPVPVVTFDELIRATNVDMSLINCRISDDDILALADFVCDPWKLISKHIGIETHEISAITEENGTVTERRVASLQKWKEKNPFRATYGVLIKALLSCQKGDAAEKICEYLNTKDPVDVKLSMNTDRKDTQSVDVKIEKLKKEFGHILRTFSKEMDVSGMDIKDLKELIATIHLFRSSNDVPHSLYYVPNKVPLLTDLNQFFINPIIFKEILEIWKPKVVQTCKLMEAYVKSLRQFEEQTKLKDIAEMNYEFKDAVHVLSCYSEVEVKLKDAWQDKTLAALKQFLHSHAANCKLWFLERASIGSIVLVFLIPESEKRYLGRSYLADNLGETRLITSV